MSISSNLNDNIKIKGISRTNSFYLLTIPFGIAYLFLPHNSFYFESSFLILFMLIFIKSVSENWMRFSYVFLWMLGSLISWILVYWIYRYNFGSISETDYLRPYLFNVFLIGLTLSNVLMSSGESKVIYNFQFKGNTILITAIIVLLLLYVFTGGLASRDDNQFAKNFSGFYFVQAFIFLFYLGSFLAGFKLKLNIYLIVFAGIIGINLLGNHRGEMIANILFFLAGLALNNQVTNMRKAQVFAGLILFSSLAFVIIGQKRLAESSSSDQYTSNQFALERILEPSGQIVIDKTLKRDHFDKFENFDRIITIPIPAFLLSGKKPNDDSNEVLVEKFGYSNLGETSSIPIPFIADAFRRFGIFGVFFGSLIFGLILNKISFLLLKSNREWANIAFFLIGIYVLKIYPHSVLGTISFFLYVLPKLLIVILVIYSFKSVNDYYLRARNIC